MKAIFILLFFVPSFGIVLDIENSDLKGVALAIVSAIAALAIIIIINVEHIIQARK